MSGLVLKLGPKERVLINGAVIENGDRRSRLAIMTPNAHILRLRDAIRPDEVTTPVRRVCYIAQLVLSGDADPAEARLQLLRGIEQLSQVLTDHDSRSQLALATAAVLEDQHYQALKALQGAPAPRRAAVRRRAAVMSFQPVLPFGGYAGWKFLGRTLETQKEAFTASPLLQSDTEYFRQKIGTVTTAEGLVSDRRLLKVALGAFGLDGDIDSKYLIRKVLEDGTLDASALANKFSDKRYLALSKAFGFGDYATPSTQISDFPDKIIAGYNDRQFEIAVGDQDNTMRLALALGRDLGDLAGKGTSDTTKWYSVMGTPNLRTVFETALGLPSSFAAIDIDTQLSTLQDKTEQMFGDSSVAQFSDPEKMDKLVRTFLVRSELQGTAGGSAAQSAALTLLQSDANSSSAADGILSLLG